MLRPSAARHAGWCDIIREDDDAVRSGYPIPDVFEVRTSEHFRFEVKFELFIHEDTQDNSLFSASS